jgi:hypothetical protein
MGNRARAAAIAFAVATGSAVAGPSWADGVDAADGKGAIAAEACVPREECCAVCDKGQACGNSCISRAKQCHKGRGCACNLSEVCAPDAP